MSNDRVTQAKLLLSILSSGSLSRRTRDYFTVLKSSIYQIPIKDYVISFASIGVNKFTITPHEFYLKETILNNVSIGVVSTKIGPTKVNVNDKVCNNVNLSIVTTKIAKTYISCKDSFYTTPNVNVNKINVVYGISSDVLVNSVSIGVIKK